MSRKRKPDQPTQETETTTNTAVAEPGTGEQIEQESNFVERVGERNSPIPTPDPFVIAGDYVAGVQLFESKRDRQMAIKFEEKPSQSVIYTLKESGFRWSPADRIWTHSVRLDSAMSTRIDAERLYQEVRRMIRQEKGIDAGQEVPF